MLRKGVIVSVVVFSLFALTSSALAAGNIAAQAFGTKPVVNVTNIKADVWTAVQPSGWYAIASPVGICTTSPTCSGPFVETGYYKGTRTNPQNVLQQYMAYIDPAGNTVNRFGLGNLSDNTWYNFQTAYNSSAGRWEAWRDGLMRYQIPIALTFSSGSMVACGGEGGDVGVPMCVQCSNMRYKVGTGIWTLYDYTNTQIFGIVYQYCVKHAAPYGSISWKCT
jgi:hypothetical protein